MTFEITYPGKCVASVEIVANCHSIPSTKQSLIALHTVLLALARLKLELAKFDKAGQCAKCCRMQLEMLNSYTNSTVRCFPLAKVSVSELGCTYPQRDLRDFPLDPFNTST